ncbi:MAG: hypothetical protein ACJ74U_12540 [Jatrophihabitantaceae bacterium]
MEDQIYLVPGEPYQPGEDTEPPRSGRRRALASVGLLAVALVAIGVQHVRSGHLPAPAVAHLAPAAAAASSPYQQWPRGAGVCDSRVDLPQVSWTRVAEPTGMTVPVEGTPPALVDVDTGRRSAIPGLRLRPDQFASKVIRSGEVSYVLVRSCPRRWMATVIRAQAGQPQRVVSGDRTIYGLISDDAGAVWAEAYTGPTKVSPAAALGTTLVRLDRPAPAVELPPALNVIGLSGDQVIATAAGPPEAVGQDRLYRYDLTSRRASLLGRAYSATESRGVVLWTSTPCSAWGACPLRSLNLRTGQATNRGYHLPLGSSISGGVLSPDGHKLAFALQREIADPYYRSDLHPQNPADLVVLDLTDGVAEPVPNLTLPPGAMPSTITFSADSTWLVVTLPGDGRIDLYSWRSGLSQPQRTPPPEWWTWPDVSDKQID